MLFDDTDRQTDRQTDRHTHRQTDRQTKRQGDRDIDTERQRQISNSKNLFYKDCDLDSVKTRRRECEVEVGVRQRVE